MKIATILPYKENYSKNGAGAVALWISEFLRDSINKKTTYIFGSTENKNYLSKNYININLSEFNSRFTSTTKNYSYLILKKVKEPTKGSFIILKARPEKGSESDAFLSMFLVSVGSPGRKPV